MQTGTVIIDNPTKQTPTWLLPGNMTYLNPELRESPGSHPLPWGADSALFHVVFRLTDWISKAKQDPMLKECKRITERACHDKRPFTVEEEQRIQHLLSSKIEEYLSANHVAGYLSNDTNGRLAVEGCNGQKYLIHAWCILSTHGHAIVEIKRVHTMAELLKHWKNLSAQGLNTLLDHVGSLWNPDEHDQIITPKPKYSM